MTTLLLSGCESTSTRNVPDYRDIYYLDKIIIDFEVAKEPMHVAEIETAYRKQSLADGSLSQIGQRFTGRYRDAKQKFLYDQIAIALEGQVRAHIGKDFKGQKPATLRVVIDNVFMRAHLDLAAMTGTQVTINGVARPTENQMIARIELSDEAAGVPIDLLMQIRATNNGVTLGGSRETFGPFKRTNNLARNWAMLAAQRIDHSAKGIDNTIFGY